jgi:hypothetical protein
METLIAGLRALVDRGGLTYKMPDIVRIIKMGADHSFIWN